MNKDIILILSLYGIALACFILSSLGIYLTYPTISMYFLTFSITITPLIALLNVIYYLFKPTKVIK